MVLFTAGIVITRYDIVVYNGKSKEVPTPTGGYGFLLEFGFFVSKV